MRESSALSAVLEEVRELQARRDYVAIAERLSGEDPADLLAEPELGILLAEAWRRGGERERALGLVQQLSPICGLRGDRLSRNCSNLEGILYFELGQVAAAEAEWGRLLAASSRAGDEEFVARANQNLGIIQTLAGQRSAALASQERAIISYQKLGHLRGLAQAHNNLAISFREMGFPDDADAAFRKALEYARIDGSEDEVARVEEEWALLLALRGDSQLAAITAARSLERFRKLGEPAGGGDAMRILGIVALWDGRLGEAKQWLEQALAVAHEWHLRLLEAETLEAQAALADASGDGAGASSIRCNADSIFEELRAVEWGRQIRAQLVSRAHPSAGSEGGPT